MENRRRCQRILIAVLLLGGLLPVIGYHPRPAGQPPLALTTPAEHRQNARASFSSAASPTAVTATHRPARTPTATPFRPSPPTATRRPSATPLPPTATLPSRAQVEGITGFAQYLPLSCEARSAVDWARYFGREIHESQFFERLPRSGDPELGFVGSPYGVWGQIPPDSYGVHAAPVAALLREYGLMAAARRNLSLESVLSEIAAGRPVIVWVTGHVEAGKGVEIQVDGQVRTVARYEHTVILIGYDDSATLTFLDGAKVYHRPVDLFLAAWAPLENMAVMWGNGEVDSQ